MSTESQDKRLGRVEGDVSQLKADVAVLKRDTADMRGDVTKVATGVEELLRRDATRPQPTNWRTAIATVIALMGGIGMLATFSWWFTSVSPPVVALGKQLGELATAIDKRLTRIDDPEIGRLPRVEKRLDAVERWRPTVTVAK